jgi:branched-chain amino acid transport system permease protein
VRERLRAAGYAAAGVGFFALPQLLGSDRVAYQTAIIVAIFAVMAYGLDLLVSYLGEVSLGQPLFWAAGAYVGGLLATRYGWGAWATAGAALGVCVAVATAVGLLTIRTRDFVFSLVTYATTIVALGVVSNWGFVGASDGIVGIPQLDLSLLGLELAPSGDDGLWPYAFALLAATVYGVHRFRRSRLGMAALMVNLNPALAASMGLDERRIRVRVFVLSAVITGAAGWLYAYQRSFVGPDLLGTYFLVLMLTAVVISGRRVLLGPVVGVLILVLQQNYASVGTNGDAVVLGAILAGVLILWPTGLVGAWAALRRRGVRASGGPRRAGEPVPDPDRPPAVS